VSVQTPIRQSATRIIVLGGGFAGIYTARHLQKFFARRTDVEILLVSRDNFLLMTPLLFEVCSGKLEMSACSISIREFLGSVGFAEAMVEAIDLERREVLVSAEGADKRKLPYDHLVLTLGSLTNTSRIEGSELAFTFKTLADAILLRNHIIERMERAEVESDSNVRRRELTFVVIGGGLVGVEVFGELTAFMDEVVRYYPRIRREEIHLHLLQAGERIMPEISEKLADYSTHVLSRRLGVSIRTSTPVERITPGQVHLKNEILEASTIILSAGTTPSPIVAGLRRCAANSAPNYGRLEIAHQYRIRTASPIPSWRSMRCERRRCWPRTFMRRLMTCQCSPSYTRRRELWPLWDATAASRLRWVFRFVDFRHGGFGAAIIF